VHLFYISGRDDASTFSDGAFKTKNGRRKGPPPRLLDPESIEKRRKQREWQHGYLETLSEKERQKRLDCARKYRKQREENETPEEKERRLQRKREYRAGAFNKERHQRIMMTETEQQRAKRLEIHRRYERKKRMLMTEVQLKEMNARKREKYKEEALLRKKRQKMRERHG
jgi:hypothetical protein